MDWRVGRREREREQSRTKKRAYMAFYIITCADLRGRSSQSVDLAPFFARALFCALVPIHTTLSPLFDLTTREGLRTPKIDTYFCTIF